MNYRVVLSALGNLLMILGLSMFLPFLWSVYYGEKEVIPLLSAAVVTLLTGIALSRFFKSSNGLTRRNSYMVVSLGWVIAILFGTLPYIFSGTFVTFADALFETASGFTTTGASVLEDVEALPKGILFWRSLTHWLGGMGIMVLFVAIISHIGIGAIQVFKAETPGHSAEKLTPKVKDTAKTLWITYVTFTMLEILLLLFAGMDLFNAMCHTFGTLATGGFSTKNASIGHYGPLIQWIVIAFMFVGGTNFGLMYLSYTKKSLNTLWRSEEFRFYVFIVFSAILLVFTNLVFFVGTNPLEAIRLSAFQVISITTTTGYATADFGAWPLFGQVLLFMLMFSGGCNGSTSGSIKVGRHLILLKHSVISLKRVLHPRAVMSIKVDEKPVEQTIILHILQFFFIFIFIFTFGFLFMSTIGGLDFPTALTSSVACLANIGPGLSMVGPTENYAIIPAPGKYMLSFLMLIGRLEIFTVLVLFLPSNWKK